MPSQLIGYEVGFRLMSLLGIAIYGWGLAIGVVVVRSPSVESPV